MRHYQEKYLGHRVLGDEDIAKVHALKTAHYIALLQQGKIPLRPAKKPAPDIYHWALEKLDLPAEQCLALEDSRAGLLSAINAGVAVCCPVHKNQENAMSRKHPIIAVTGSSGAGTTTVKTAFEHIFHRQRIKPVIIEGDSFHRYDRKDMKEKVMEAQKKHSNFSHFGLEANLLKELEDTFRTYGETGRCKRRYYLHNDEEAKPYGQKPGTFTQWEDVGEGSDLLFYEGLHGAVVDEAHGINVAQYADLKIGVVPIVNLEWIQKIHRDTAQRGYKPEDVTDTILRRMADYVSVITPQFSNTDINFQRVPLVDTRHSHQ